MAAIDTVLLTVASRCNLNCTYCYVYNMGDDGWRSLPKRMSDGVQRAVVDQLAALSRAQGRPFSIVLRRSSAGERRTEAIARLSEPKTK